MIRFPLSLRVGLLLAALSSLLCCSSHNRREEQALLRARKGEIVRRIVVLHRCATLSDRGTLSGQVERMMNVARTQLDAAALDAQTIKAEHLARCLLDQRRRVDKLAAAHHLGEDSYDICTDLAQLVRAARACR
ncbi:MAG: hypothetical protein H6707_00590 [Deltaproteobacteria bacterium]|nr:hypothetical protein [Deltaproteobacteria bacterium]